MRAAPGGKALEFSTDPADAPPSTIAVRVRRLCNFGYSGRAAGSVRQHVGELVALGMPAPAVIPAMFPLPVDKAITRSTVTLSGMDSYGEVEFALVLADDDDWYVTVASDHSDALVETLSTPRAKSIYPDVLAPSAWRLTDVRGHWDDLRLTCRRLDEAGETVTQQGSLAELLPPEELLSIAGERIGERLPAGTILLSGTIGGLPRPGAAGWEITLDDPFLGRSISHRYRVEALPDELVSTVVDAPGGGR